MGTFGSCTAPGSLVAAPGENPLFKFDPSARK